MIETGINFDNIDSHLKDTSLNNQELYLKLYWKTVSTHLFTSITFLDDSNLELPIVGCRCRCNNSFSEIKIQEHYITDYISIIPVNKAVGPDCISHKMLKSCKGTISKPRCILLNKSLSLKFFPDFGNKHTFFYCWRKMTHY